MMSTLPSPSMADRATIEPMATDDLLQVLEIERASFPHPWSRAQFMAELERRPSVCLVLRDGSRVIGHLIIWIIATEMHILNIAIHPDYRGQGLGRLFMDYLMDLARERQVTEIFLEVRPSNRPALALYDRCGFETTGLRKNYYSEEHEDAILMTCRLDRSPPLRPD